MDVGQAFAFINEDEEWLKKVGIGAIVGAIPIVNFAVFGYQAEVARNVVAGEERPLPEWQDFGKYFVNGLRIVGAMFVYLLPVILLTLCASLSMFFIVEPTGQPTSGSTPPPPEIFVIFGLMFACIMPYTIFINIIWPLFTIQNVREEKFRANFRFSEMWRLIRRQPGNYILIVVLYFGLYMGVSFLLFPAIILLFIPCLGWIAYLLLSGAAMMLVMLVIGHLQGQFILNDSSDSSSSTDPNTLAAEA